MNYKKNKKLMRALVTERMKKARGEKNRQSLFRNPRYYATYDSDSDESRGPFERTMSSNNNQTLSGSKETV